MRTLLLCLLLVTGCRAGGRPTREPEPGEGDGRRRAPSSTPAPPVERQVRIRVWDSGMEPDDAFRLSIDGTTYGETPLGGERTFEVTLTKGAHTLSLSGIGAPDGQGTYALEAQAPLTFESGPARRGVGLNQGVTFRWQVRVE
jgi:hypothetical protein